MMPAAVEYRPPKKTTSKPTGLYLPPLYPDETLKSIAERSQTLVRVIDDFEKISMDFKKELLNHSLNELKCQIEASHEIEHVLNVKKWPDYPPIVLFDVSNLILPCDYKAIISELQPSDSDDMVCPLYCQQDDSFSSIMFRILKTLNIAEEFTEKTLESFSELGSLTLFLFDSDRLPSKSLEILLEYFRKCTNNTHITFVLDSPVCLHQLNPKLKIALKFFEVQPKQDIFDVFLAYLSENQMIFLRVHSKVIRFIKEQCVMSNLHFRKLVDILKWCLIRTISNNPYFYNEEMQNETMCASIVNQLTSKGHNCAKLEIQAQDNLRSLQNNDVVLQVVKILDKTWKHSDLLVEIQSANFGTKVYLDRLEDRLKSLTPDEIARLLVLIRSYLDSLAAECPAKNLLVELVQSFFEKKHKDTSATVCRLKEILVQLSYFCEDSPFAPFLLYDDVKELRRVFFPDSARAIQEVLKHPSEYFKSCGGSTSRSSSRLAKKQHNLPDTCRVYRLMLEWQRLVNLHDLYFQFEGQVHEVVAGGAKKKPTAEQQKAYITRFMQAVAELELKGFWGPMGRKRDTYERHNFCDGFHTE